MIREGVTEGVHEWKGDRCLTLGVKSGTLL